MRHSSLRSSFLHACVVAALLSGCLGRSPSELDVLASRAACEAILCALGYLDAKARCEQSFPADAVSDSSRGVEAGRLQVDSAKLGECLEAYEAFDFSQCWGEDPATFERPEACDQLWTGLVANGDACFLDAECKAGWCDAGELVCPGVCQAWFSGGAACSRDAQCGDGRRCIEGKCGTDRREGVRCTTTSACGEGLYCGSARTCVPKVVEGAECTMLGACVDGFECQCKDARCEVGLCLKREVAVGGDCSFRLCADGLACVSFPAGKQCLAKSGTGGSCRQTTNGANDACKGRQICRGVTSQHEGTCAVPSGVGGDCATEGPSGCAHDLLCDTTTSKCVVAPAAGSPCVNGTCAASAYCATGQCFAKLAGGAQCANGAQCQSGSCTFDETGHRVCDETAPATESVDTACHAPAPATEG